MVRNHAQKRVSAGVENIVFARLKRKKETLYGLPLRLQPVVIFVGAHDQGRKRFVWLDPRRNQVSGLAPVLPGVACDAVKGGGECVFGGTGSLKKFDSQEEHALD